MGREMAESMIKIRTEHPAERKRRHKYSLSLSSKQEPFPITPILAVIIYTLTLAFFTALLVLGCVGLHDIYKKDLTWGKIIYSISATSVFIGVTGIVISIIGLTTIFYKKRNLQIALVVCLSIMALFLIAFLIVIISVTITEEDYRVKSEEAMIKSIGYYHSADSKDDVYWDRLQQSFNCCGANDYRDWNNNNQYYKVSTENIPKSCCIMSKNGVYAITCQNANLNEKNVSFFAEGCYGKLKDYAQSHMPVIAGVAATAAFLTIFSLILSGYILKGFEE